MSTMSDEDERPKHDGFALAASFAVWGATLWMAPSYVEISGVLLAVCYVVGGLCVAISFCGAFIELERYVGSEAFGWWGVGGFFLILAVLLHLAAVSLSLTSSLETVAKVTALLLLMGGVPFLFYGIASTLELGGMKRTASKRRSQSSWKDVILTTVSFASASVPILATVVKALLGS